MKKNPNNETVAMNETGTMNEIRPMSSMFLEKIVNETRPMSFMSLDKITNETKPMNLNTKISEPPIKMNETKTMKENKTMNETKIMNETIHRQNSTTNTIEVNYFISNFIQCLLIHFILIFQILTLGLLDATLNIDRSIDILQSHNSNHDHNIVISPISIAAAMSLVLLGAHGETKTEVGKLFGFDEYTTSHLGDK